MSKINYIFVGYFELCTYIIPDVSNNGQPWQILKFARCNTAFDVVAHRYFWA